MELFIILANLFSFLGHSIDCVSVAVLKTKDKLILSNLISSICSLISMAFFMSISGVTGVLVTLTRLLTIYIKDKKNLELKPLFIVFLVLYGMAFFDNNKLIASTVFISNMCSFLPKWFSNDIQKVRIGGMIACVFAITQNIMLRNVAALPFLVVSIFSAGFGYITSLLKNRKNISITPLNEEAVQTTKIA